MRKPMKRTIASIVLVLMCFATSHAIAATDYYTNPKDPYENFNRHAYKLNHKLDQWILKPTAKAYNHLPKPARTGINNFFSNLRQLPTIFNDLLQLNIRQATADSWRFFFNSTIGIAGFIDVAQYMDLPRHTQDFGLTLAKWGWTNSSYLVVPFWGPSTIRDGIALIPDYYTTVYPYIYPWQKRYGLLTVDVVDMRASFLNMDEVARQAALDPYIFQRDAYLQHRAYKIAQNNEKYDPYDSMNDDVLDN